MADGTLKPIEELKENDVVMTMDTATGELSGERVLNLIIHENNSGGYLIVNGSLEVTPNHAMWIKKIGEWTRMEFVKIGDEFTDSNGNPVIIQSIEFVPGEYTVYNLHLEGPNSNYFAGGVLVHNQYKF